MAKIQKSIEIEAPLREVYDFFTNPENLPEVWPSLVEVSNIAWGAEGADSFDWVYKMAGIRFHGRSETRERKPYEKVVFQNKSGIPSTFIYSYSKRDGNCWLTMEVDYEIPGKVLSKLAEPFVRRLNEHEADVLLENLKARMELTGEAAAKKRRAPSARPEPRA